MKTICNMTLEEYTNKISAFHGHEAPGLIIGGFMVDLAMKNFTAGEFFDAICETSTCLPDAVQLLTPCTIGNGWLKIINAGKFAIVFYNKETGEGVRVFLDTEKLKSYNEIYNWFMKLKKKHEQDKELLLNEIKNAGDSILSYNKINVAESFLGKKSMGQTGICPVCNEAYPIKDGNKCIGCQGSMPYS